MTRAATRSAARRSDSAARPCAPDRTRRTRRSPRRRRTTSRPLPASRSADHCITRCTPYEMPKPSPIPIAPPARLSTIDSTRNCSSTSTSRAPTAQAQPDLARPLGHRHEHDVHDADAADDERDRRDAGQQVRHRVRRRGQHARHLLERPHQEVVVGAGLDLMARAQQRRDLLGHRVERHAVLRRHGDVRRRAARPSASSARS